MTHSWQQSYPPGLDWQFAGHNAPIHTLFEKAATAYPERLCTDFMGREVSYGQMLIWVNAVARALQDKGFTKGDRVGICLPNTPYFLACYYGALKAGMTVVHFNPLYTEAEIKAQMVDSGVKMMITIDVAEIYAKVAACVGAGELCHVVVCPLAGVLPPVKSLLYRCVKAKDIARYRQDAFTTPWGEFISNTGVPKTVDIQPETDIALFQYTGGTTGVPKAAKLTHAAVMSNATQVTQWLGDMGPDQQRMMAVLPFFHVFAMTAVMNMAVALGAAIMMLPRFELKLALKTIARTKPTLFPGVPTLFNALNQAPETKKYDLSSIRYCISGGAPLPKQIKASFEQLSGATVIEGYGLSEASPVVTCNPRHNGGKIGSIGLPLPGTEVEIRDLTDGKTPMPTGERGELFVRGPQVMAGYHGRPEETAHTLVNGWLRTGDVGYIDTDGYVFLTDRLKELILVSGYNVYPRLIEEALYRHPDVEEVIVIGIPHPYKGEVPKGYVKLKAGGTISADGLMAFANDSLNPLEVLHEIEFRDDLPKTLIGKLSKKELIDEIKHNLKEEK